MSRVQGHRNATPDSIKAARYLHSSRGVSITHMNQNHYDKYFDVVVITNILLAAGK
jgi:ACT domain-containing protein